ncbi:MAG: MBL fold metallo-hydrolase, partial [Lachnospiraceae bacterium]|nr:MBL fold metallo-hydrolase [Lachnospiraceae bacterium]
MDFINVGDGDAILLRQWEAGREFVVMVDCGRPVVEFVPGSKRGSAVNYLMREGVEAIDVLWLSHLHIDHIGGFFEIARHVPIGKVLTAYLPPTGAKWIYAPYREEKTCVKLCDNLNYFLDIVDTCKALGVGVDMVAEGVWPPRPQTDGGTPGVPGSGAEKTGGGGADAVAVGAGSGAEKTEGGDDDAAVTKAGSGAGMTGGADADAAVTGEVRADHDACPVLEMHVLPFDTGMMARQRELFDRLYLGIPCGAEEMAAVSRERNPAGLRLLFTYRGRKVLLTADVYGEVWEDIVGADWCPVDILKLPHHGNEKSLTARSVEILSP